MLYHFRDLFFICKMKRWLMRSFRWYLCVHLVLLKCMLAWGHCFGRSKVSMIMIKFMKSDSIFSEWEHFMIYILECKAKGCRDAMVIESPITHHPIKTHIHFHCVWRAVFSILNTIVFVGISIRIYVVKINWWIIATEGYMKMIVIFFRVFNVGDILTQSAHLRF